jgi:uncharacterized SAM-dependent methyltransferase
LSAEHIKWIEGSGFRDDVLRGLSGRRRSVPSRWLYDARGSELFEEITRLEEYYPARTEAEIPREAAKPIGAFVWPRPVIVEYGAGAASIHTESSRKYDAQSFTRLTELGDWDVAEALDGCGPLFAVFGLVAAASAQGG